MSRPVVSWLIVEGQGPPYSFRCAGPRIADRLKYSVDGAAILVSAEKVRIK